MSARTLSPSSRPGRRASSPELLGLPVGAMAQADVGHGVKAVFPEGKLIKGHEIHCMATTASGTFGAPLRNKAGHQAQDDVVFARHTCEHGLCATCPIGSCLSALERIRSTNVPPAGFRGRRVLSDLLAHYWQLRGGSSGGKGACARGGDPIGF